MKIIRVQAILDWFDFEVKVFNYAREYVNINKHLDIIAAIFSFFNGSFLFEASRHAYFFCKTNKKVG